MNKIEIPISKTKTSLILLIGLIFVIIGALFILTPEKFTTSLYRNPQTILIIGIAAVLFFGAASIYGFIKLFDKRIGLSIDENGITDNSNASSVGLIEWNDIVEIKTEHFKYTKFILIYISNPNKYLKRVNGFKRKLMQANMNMYGTPLSITSSTLKYNFDDLDSLLKDNLKQKEKMPNR
ncbi:MAG: hypothetical protein JXQ69_01195 [Paludibacteraceae bacterium]|nr:hypothetical protein [Paludibacteraceae bacterium]MBN2786914.1 hypothetical protein [Paludibacteraceae bacterium]